MVSKNIKEYKKLCVSDEQDIGHSMCCLWTNIYIYKCDFIIDLPIIMIVMGYGCKYVKKQEIYNLKKSIVTMLGGRDKQIEKNIIMV